MINPKSRIPLTLTILLTLIITQPTRTLKSLKKHDDDKKHEDEDDEKKDYDKEDHKDVIVHPTSSEFQSQDLIDDKYELLLSSHMSEVSFDKETHDYKSEAQHLVYGKQTIPSVPEKKYLNDLVFEIKNNKQDFKLARANTTILKKTLSSENDYLEFTDTAYSLYKVDPLTFHLYFEVESSDCLTMYVYLSESSTPYTYTIDEAKKRFNIDVKSETNHFVEDGRQESFPYKTYDNWVKFHTPINKDKDNYLHFFCPFWVNKENPTAKYKIHQKRIEDLKIEHGEIIFRNFLLFLRNFIQI